MVSNVTTPNRRQKPVTDGKHTRSRRHLGSLVVELPCFLSVTQLVSLSQLCLSCFAWICFDGFAHRDTLSYFRFVGPASLALLSELGLVRSPTRISLCLVLHSYSWSASLARRVFPGQFCLSCSAYLFFASLALLSPEPIYGHSQILSETWADVFTL